MQSDFVQPSTLLVAPTSTSAKWAQYRPEIDVDGTSTRVLIEQTMAVDPQRLGDFAGRLNVHEMAAVNEALKLVFALRVKQFQLEGPLSLPAKPTNRPWILTTSTRSSGG